MAEKYKIEMQDEGGNILLPYTGTDSVIDEDGNTLKDILENGNTYPADEMTVEFTEAKTRENISSLEKLSTIMGKIKKWFTDLAEVAFSGSYSDLSDTPTIPSGAAASYAVANNDTTTASGYVADARIVRTHGLEIDQLSSDLGGITFGIDEDGNYGYYKDGADTVTPFRVGPDSVTFGGYMGGIADVKSPEFHISVPAGATRIVATLSGTSAPWFTLSGNGTSTRYSLSGGVSQTIDVELDSSASYSFTISPNYYNYYATLSGTAYFT